MIETILVLNKFELLLLMQALTHAKLPNTEGMLEKLTKTTKEKVHNGIVAIEKEEKNAHKYNSH